MSSSPSHEELGQLPLRAIVAFAARCARRVLPLYHGYLGHEKPASVEKAVESGKGDGAGKGTGVVGKREKGRESFSSWNNNSRPAPL
jgi:hypothetical protein